MLGTEQERAVLFEAKGETLFGVLTEPASESNGTGILLIQGGDTVNISFHRNRLAVRLARTLGERGYRALRFDYHGLGESTGEIRELRLSAPFAEDAVAAARCLTEAGADRIIMVGACFSARTALSAAPEVPNLAGILMATPPVASYERTEAQAEWLARDRPLKTYVRKALRPDNLRRLLTDPASRRVFTHFGRAKLREVGARTKARAGLADPFGWVSGHLLSPLRTMVERRIPVMIVYGVDDPLLREFDRATEGELGRILEDGAGTIEVVDNLPGVVHGFAQLDSQEAFLKLALEWIDRITGR
jgi:pimeloyl-ACP methyl ester carboxylesterase